MAAEIFKSQDIGKAVARKVGLRRTSFENAAYLMEAEVEGIDFKTNAELKKLLASKCNHFYDHLVAKLGEMSKKADTQIANFPPYSQGNFLAPINGAMEHVVKDARKELYGIVFKEIGTFSKKHKVDVSKLKITIDSDFCELLPVRNKEAATAATFGKVVESGSIEKAIHFAQTCVLLGTNLNQRGLELQKAVKSWKVPREGPPKGALVRELRVYTMSLKPYEVDKDAFTKQLEALHTAVENVKKSHEAWLKTFNEKKDSLPKNTADALTKTGTAIGKDLEKLSKGIESNNKTVLEQIEQQHKLLSAVKEASERSVLGEVIRHNFDLKPRLDTFKLILQKLVAYKPLLQKVANTQKLAAAAATAK